MILRFWILSNQASISSMTYACNLGCISRSISSRWRETIILIHVRCVRPHLEGVSWGCKMHVNRLQHILLKGPTIEGWSTQCTRIRLRELREGQKGVKLLSAPTQGKVEEKMEPGSEEAAKWKDKKQRMQVATGDILNRKPLPLESTLAVEQVPTKAAESPPLEMFKIWGEMPWEAWFGFTLVPLWAGSLRGLDYMLLKTPSCLNFSVSLWFDLCYWFAVSKCPVSS